MQLPDHPKLDDLAVVSSTYVEVHERWSRLMAEIVPEVMPQDLLAAMTAMTGAMISLGHVIEGHARYYGYQGPKP